MSWRSRARLFGVATCLTLAGIAVCLASASVNPRGAAVSSASPAAKPKLKPITGTLSKPGYTVLALGATGKVTSVRVKGRKFSLRPPVADVTLHLRAANGVYAGPVVVASRQGGKRAIVGVKAGVRLGDIKINARKGFAKVTRKLPKAWFDEQRWARAKKGVPIGAGDFGRVRSTPPQVSPPGDLDADGVPDRLDVDINGNLILNNVDRSTASRVRTSRVGGRLHLRAAAAEAAALREARAEETSGQFHIHSVLNLPLYETANADALTLSDSDIDKALASWGVLILGILPGNPELDCGGAPDPSNPQGWSGGLSYCTRGGTGLEFIPGQPADRPRFPDDFDSDGDGLGTLVNNSSFPAPGYFFFSPGATTSQIGTGDVLIERATSGDTETDAATMLPFIFATVPALVSYDDGAGNSATVKYPVASPDPGPGGPGTGDNPFPVTAQSNGDVMLRLTLWRPQRRPIAGEVCGGSLCTADQWIDIGKLTYAVGLMRVGSLDTSKTAGPAGCPQVAFSNYNASLTPATPPYGRGSGGLKDLTTDQTASPGNTITFTLDLSKCLAAHELSWAPGDTADVQFAALDDAVGSTLTETETGVVFVRR